MKKLLILLLLVCCALAPRQPSCLRLDVVLLGDYSGSVGGHEHFIVEAFKAFSNQFILSEDDFKFGIITFGERTHVICRVTSDQATFKAGLARLSSMAAFSESTDIGVGLDAATNELIENGRMGVRKVIVLVSDGLHNAGSLEGSVERARLAGCIIACVVIKDTGANTELMRALADPGFYVESSYGDLVNVIKKLDICL